MKTVYRGYDQKQLDEQYNNQRFVTNISIILDRMASESARVRKDFAFRTFRYGKSDDEILDFFPADSKSSPALVFVHGGGWRLSSKNDVSYFAEAFVPAGVHYVAINYGLAPSITLDEIVRQCRASIAWLHENQHVVGVHSDRMFVLGHSSGAHIAAMMLSTNWSKFGLNRQALHGGSVFSGMYDLEPVRLSFRNSYLNLDAEGALRNSPIRCIPSLRMPLIVGWGEHESQEFRRQGAEYARAWAGTGSPCTPLELRGLNHFEVADELIDGSGAVFRRVLAQMGIG